MTADRARTPLFVALAATCLVALTSIGLSTVIERVAELKESISHYEKLRAQLEKASPRDETEQSPFEQTPTQAETIRNLREQIENERDRYYRPGSMTLSRYASSVQTELAAGGLVVLRYRPIEAAPGKACTEVEFVVRGPGEAILAFLMGTTSGGKYRYVRDVSIHRAVGGSAAAAPGRSAAGAMTVEATIRLGYGQVDEVGAH